MENIEKLKELCNPLVEYLQNHCDPYVEIHVSSDEIKVMYIECGIPLPEDNKENAIANNMLERKVSELEKKVAELEKEISEQPLKFKETLYDHMLRQMSKSGFTKQNQFF